MLKIHGAVRGVLFDDEEALFAMSRGFMSLSKYARRIKNKVAELTKKPVGIGAIVIALSRIKGEIRKNHPLLAEVRLNSVNTKSPLTELVYKKTETLIERVGSLSKSVRATNDDFLTVTISTGEIGVTCSDRILDRVKKHLGGKSVMEQNGLAMIGLSIDPIYYSKPNITYSLIRRIARRRIVLAETVSTHGEIIFTFNAKQLPEMLELFTPLQQTPSVKMPA